ncbi:pyridoxal-phosphate dependent enzyme [Amycolatopsis acidiphila]|uniref:Pyridoxal-phosphate dependent enzyme n=1 Tax=Amycolatopsis acidiphila TaxID=715473 RepID=A0A558A877_9PSEU|nr:pyridoxal-phosphate dependent enzyme [Amycolatopsis acidiphila]TVT20463.1 pyridoxal-phosphate dependent enzyme [Amycolatopsis acidiphila]UIJ56984.1 pyridoxal-phosphate dependent enzyme [Amycolatopsis acidiphila]GHG53973.1 hypothetical protein GCM10017788_03230 [Amycolatopsis acidiphila]
MTTLGLPGSGTGIDEEMLDGAWEVVSRHLPPTPLIPFPQAGFPVPVYLKYDGAQPMGTFKVRGALAALTAYGAAGKPVVTASVGNHALGMAYGSRLLSVDSTVVVPKTAAPVKIAALGRYPINLVLEGDDFDGAERHALDLGRNGMRYVSAYTDRYVIAGQSTLATEVANVLDEDFTVVVPAGGGGLLSGVALGARRAKQDVRVVGVEADACRALSTAVAAGHVVPVPMGETIADGLYGNLEPSSITPRIVRDCGSSSDTWPRSRSGGRSGSWWPVRDWWPRARPRPLWPRCATTWCPWAGRNSSTTALAGILRED